jgi:hypothetical protein
MRAGPRRGVEEHLGDARHRGAQCLVELGRGALDPSRVDAVVENDMADRHGVALLG